MIDNISSTVSLTHLIFFLNRIVNYNLCYWCRMDFIFKLKKIIKINNPMPLACTIFYKNNLWMNDPIKILKKVIHTIFTCIQTLKLSKWQYWTCHMWRTWVWKRTRQKSEYNWKRYKWSEMECGTISDGFGMECRMKWSVGIQLVRIWKRAELGKQGSSRRYWQVNNWIELGRTCNTTGKNSGERLRDLVHLGAIKM